jgi:hypothetical protein
MTQPFSPKVANPMSIPVNPANALVLTVMAKDAEEFAYLDQVDRAEITLVGPQNVILSEVLYAISMNAKFNNGQWQIPLRGMMVGRAGASPFHSVIVAEAALPVTIRRKYWPINKKAMYTNGLAGLKINGVDTSPSTDGITRSSFNLTTLDFAADDWVLVDNPNCVPVDVDEDGNPVEPEETQEIQGVQTPLVDSPNGVKINHTAMSEPRFATSDSDFDAD